MALTIARPRRGTGAASRFRCAAEALERLRSEIGGHPVALVCDVDLDAHLALRREEPNGPRAVPERVLDQVPERLPETEPVGYDRETTAVDLDMATRLLSAALKSGRDPVEELIDNDRLCAER